MAKLREIDALHRAEIGSYHDLINNLHAYITSNGLAIPNHLKLPHTRSPEAEVSFIDFPDGSQSLQATMPSFQEFRHTQQHPQGSKSPEQVLSATTSGTDESGDVERRYIGRIESLNISQQRQIAANMSAQGTVTPAQLQNMSMPPPEGHLGYESNLDTAQVAVDFVLALERPCLAHHPLDFDDLNTDSSGHSLMLQSPLLSHQPNRSQATSSSASTHPTTQATSVGTSSSRPKWSVPAFEIEKLFNLSGRLSLEGELTPIEAWQRIRKHPGFPAMKNDQLETMRDVLLSNVKCYG